MTALQGRINSLHADLANARLDQQMGLLSVLTAEQRKELRRGFLKMEDFGMGGMMGGMRHHMRGHGGPGCGSGGHHGGGGGHGGEDHEGGPDHKEHASNMPVDKS